MCNTVSYCYAIDINKYFIIIETVNKYAGFQNTEQVRNSIKQEINRVLLAAVMTGLLNSHLWSCDNRVEVYKKMDNNKITITSCLHKKI